MAKIIAKNVVKRSKGKLYYIDAKGNVCEASMNRKGGKKGRKSCSVKAAPKKKKAAPKKRKVVRKSPAKRKAPAKRRAPAKRKTKRATKRK